MKKKNLDKIVSAFTGREVSLFDKDIAVNRSEIEGILSGKSVLVIGGAGSIGSAFIREVLQFPVQRVFVIDHNENGLAELIRDIRSDPSMRLPEIMTYPVSFGSDEFKSIFKNQGPFEVVANFAALKHVRSEKDVYAVKAMLRNNVLLNYELLEMLSQNPPEHFFSVSTDKATNPVNIMGASKKLMEDLLFSYCGKMKITTARFANVAFSNGSLLESFIKRVEKEQALVCPLDIRRYFISRKEAGQLCLLTCLLGKTGETFIPKLGESALISFDRTLHAFLNAQGLKAKAFTSESEVRKACQNLKMYVDKGEYPVFFFHSDTSGEKPFEEFYTADDVVDRNRFEGIGVIQAKSRNEATSHSIYNKGRALLDSVASKQEFIDFFKEFIPEFEHMETGKNLDSKM
jgi:FlaA1/EpsC-like NDP-sugar epimerase